MRLFVFISAVFILSNCRHSQPDVSLSSSKTSDQMNVLVIYGGFNSCPDDSLVLDSPMRAGKTAQMMEMFEKNVQKLEDTIVFYGCYTGLSSLLKNKTNAIQMRYAWNIRNLEKDLPTVSKVSVPQGKSFKKPEYLTKPIAAIKSLISDLEAKGKTVKLHLIGHSYGGFTVINLAQHFTAHLKSLFTMDAISPIDCQAKSMVTEPGKTMQFELLGSSQKKKEKGHPGCAKAPSDPSSKTAIQKIQTEIKASKGEKWWVNVYQDSFIFLHSSEIKPVSNWAPKNQRVDFAEVENIVLNGDYHSQLPRLEITWSVAIEKLSSFPYFEKKK